VIFDVDGDTITTGGFDITKTVRRVIETPTRD
jgi:hypothetical protein